MADFFYAQYHFDPRLAEHFGNSETAWMIEHIRFCVDYHRKNPSKWATEFYRFDRWWMFETAASWSNRLPWISERTVSRHLQKLRDQGIIRGERLSFDKRVATLYYSVIDEAVSALLSKHEDKVANPIVSKCQSGDGQIGDVLPVHLQIPSEATLGLPKSTTLHPIKQENSTKELYTPTTPATPSGASVLDLTSPLIKAHTQEPIEATVVDLKPKPIPIQPKPIKAPKKAAKKAPKITWTNEDMDVAKEWMTFATEQMPWAAARSSVEKYATEIAKVRKATDLNTPGLMAVLNFIRNDDFWVKVAVSPAGLLTKGKSGLRKIDQILLKLRPNSEIKKQQEAKVIEDFDPNYDPFA